MAAKDKHAGSTGQLAQGTQRFNGVKVFSATMFAQRSELGETVTHWMNANPSVEIADIVVAQSSDEAFHCVSITVFYFEQTRR